MVGGVIPIILLTSLGHVFFLGTLTSKFSLSKDPMSCDFQGRYNDGIECVSILGWASGPLFETDPQCSNYRFGFFNLILQDLRKKSCDGRVLQFG